ncbi:Peptidase S24-like [Desulforhopalus singaporensis]|uniref:Peptidase S24-like n=2 Tax=Desulforhopalus singaporensis TaxID=91360 RepID=A0A1H0UVH7_9BACT|nr:Peptidase S24-like [Desulforhopalus singaporensis]SDP70310.1 Peptidase S24-like [Desulforhopalus singaporensis]
MFGVSLDIDDASQRQIVADSNVEPAPLPHHPQKQIPVISWVQAGSWQEVQDPFQPGDSDEWIITVETNHPHAFALKIRGDSMTPEFSEGDIVTVDPGVEAINGKYVIVKNGSEEATFKQLIIDGGNVYLKPLNERYPVIDMTGKELHIVGVVVEKRKKY